MSHCMVGNCVQYEGNEKCGNDRMGLEHTHSLSSAKAFSHLTVHLKNFTCSIGKAVTCNFLKQQVHYLGHIISTDEVAPDPSKTKHRPTGSQDCTRSSTAPGTSKLLPQVHPELCQNHQTIASWWWKFNAATGAILGLLLSGFQNNVANYQGRFKDLWKEDLIPVVPWSRGSGGLCSPEAIRLLYF